jgi:hypothetical protein
MKPMPQKPRIIIAQVEGSGTEGFIGVDKLIVQFPPSPPLAAQPLVDDASLAQIHCAVASIPAKTPHGFTPLKP